LKTIVKEKKKLKKPKSDKPKEKSKRRILKIVDDEIQTVDENEVEKLLESEESIAIKSDQTLSQNNSNFEDENNTDSDGSSSLESSYVLQPSLNSNSSEKTSRVLELEEENKMLQQNIKQLEKDLVNQQESSRKWIDKLEDELRTTRKREQEETATLENVVQMVEENLRKTTQRALEAEANVSKLKDEIKFLREETITRSQHEKIVDDYEFRLDSIREKSRDVAKFMHTAANKSEPLLKQLLSGVASLHVYAEQFENIDKIADVNPTRDRVV